ncbi:isochorismatase family protein [Marinomonas ostreistagni]|uniref:isochorismatase family protein n=1 Tax=Marinomonas ostreistagni TaxID=359209 RepID=UPI00194FBE2F|nr:isochorismatase family protein [Marinomonas ostreistagni]MBM6549491.1 isochorismatase family protein [Marinomonas ostreistagni]
MSIPRIASYPMPSPEQFPKNKVNWAFQPDRAVFLIHDMQAYFLRYYDQESELIQTLKRNLVAIKAFCQAHNIPVIYTAQPNDQAPEDRALLNDMWGNGVNDFPELQPVIPELAPTEADTVLVKWRYSAFHRSNLQELMQSWGRDQLLIGGVYAHIGCMVTATDAFMRDIQAFMVGDALADFSEAEHIQALVYTAGRSGSVIATQDVLNSAQGGVQKITYADLKAQVLAQLDEEDAAEFAPDEALLNFGLDSIQIMNFVSHWREQGIEVSFAELAQAETLNDWWALIEARQSMELAS